MRPSPSLLSSFHQTCSIFRSRVQDYDSTRVLDLRESNNCTVNLGSTSGTPTSLQQPYVKRTPPSPHSLGNLPLTSSSDTHSNSLQNHSQSSQNVPRRATLTGFTSKTSSVNSATAGPDGVHSILPVQHVGGGGLGVTHSPAKVRSLSGQMRLLTTGASGAVGSFGSGGFTTGGGGLAGSSSSSAIVTNAQLSLERLLSGVDR